MADHEGSLWIGTNSGLARWTNGKLQRFSITDALSTASVLSLMEDHEGNLWVGTETGGLPILRDQRFRCGSRTVTRRDDCSGTWVMSIEPIRSSNSTTRR